MLIQQSLRTAQATGRVANISARVHFFAATTNVVLTLEGTLIGSRTKNLNHALKGILRLKPQHCVLRMSNLKVMSVRGVRTLVKFAEIMHARGVRVEIEGINPAMLFILREMQVDHLFSWLVSPAFIWQ